MLLYLVSFTNILQSSFAKKLQNQAVIREKQCKALLYKKLLINCWWNWHLGSISLMCYARLLCVQITNAQKKKSLVSIVVLCFFDLLYKPKSFMYNVCEIDTWSAWSLWSWRAWFCSRPTRWSRCPRQAKIGWCGRPLSNEFLNSKNKRKIGTLFFFHLSFKEWFVMRDW